MPSTLSIADVSACIEDSRQAIVFPNPIIERVYQSETRSYRAKVLGGGIVPAILTYNAFLLVDVLLLPDTLWIASGLHVAITLWMVLVGSVLRTAPPWLVRECLAVSIPMLIAAQIMTIYMMNRGHVADHYQYLSVMIILYMNLTMRPAFRFAAVASLGVGLSYSTVLISCGSSMPSLVIGLGLMAAAIQLTLATNWRMERDARHAFLRRFLDRRRREEAEAEANRDALTGLGNRRLLDQIAADIWRDGQETTSSAAVILLDVDHFKAFNDHYGHPSGDLCLKRVADALRSTLREEGEVATRFGGEEFLLLLPHADLAAGIAAAERVRCAVEHLAIPHEAAGQGGLTVSLGVMAGPVALHGLSELIEGADTALYAAKRAGRNQVWPPFLTKESGPATFFGTKRRPREQAA